MGLLGVGREARPSHLRDPLGRHPAGGEGKNVDGARTTLVDKERPYRNSTMFLLGQIGIHQAEEWKEYSGQWEWPGSMLGSARVCPMRGRGGPGMAVSWRLR